MSQTSYSEYMKPALAGQLYDIGFNDIVTSTDTVETVPFGALVVQSSLADDQCHLPASSGDLANALGVAVSEQAIESAYPLTGNPAFYPIGRPISVLRKGRIWVAAEEIVNPTSPVFVRFASGAGGTQMGSFRKSADSTTAAQITGARYITSNTVAGGLVVVEFNLV